MKENMRVKLARAKQQVVHFDVPSMIGHYTVCGIGPEYDIKPAKGKNLWQQVTCKRCLKAKRRKHQP